MAGVAGNVDAEDAVGVGSGEVGCCALADLVGGPPVRAGEGDSVGGEDFLGLGGYEVEGDF